MFIFPFCLHDDDLTSDLGVRSCLEQVPVMALCEISGRFQYMCIASVFSLG